MITKSEKQAVALLLAAILCLAAVFSCDLEVYAEETAVVEETVTENEAVLGSLTDIPAVEETKEDTEEPSETAEVSVQEDTKEIDRKETGSQADEPEDKEKSTRAVEIEGDYEYEIQGDGTAVVKKYNGTAAMVAIPKALDGKTVSGVGEKAFADNTSMKQVEFPATVTSIQYQSFANCSNLAKVVFPSGSQLKIIEKSAFQGSGLTELNCPSVQSVGDSAFYGCYGLRKVAFGNRLISLGRCAFAYSGIQTINIPESLTKIEENTFAACHGLKQISLPNSIASIGESAFVGSGLEEIAIPDSVKSIEDYAFSFCTSLNTVNIGNGLAYISNRAFQNCSLKAVTIGGQVKTIGHFAFESNRELKQVVIPKNVTKLEYASFKDCEALGEITFPDSLEKIGGFALENTVWYNNQPGGVVYAGNVLYKYKGGMPAETSVAVREGTRGIASFAFEKCQNLQEIIIPDGVANIGEFAFYDCGNMSFVDIPASVTEIGQMALGYVASQKGNPFIGKDRLVNARGTCAKIPGFTIRGETGSAAQTYATENDFRFISSSGEVIDKVPASKPSGGTQKDLRIVPEATDNIYVIGSSEGVTITCTGEFRDFVNVYVDDREVDKSNYTVKEGSTILTFLTKYLNTLSVGKHKVTMNYTYGSVDTELNVLERQNNTAGTSDSNNNRVSGTNNSSGSANRSDIAGNARAPKTGDSDLFLFWIMAILIAAGICVMMVRKRAFS